MTCNFIGNETSNMHPYALRCAGMFQNSTACQSTLVQLSVACTANHVHLATCRCAWSLHAAQYQRAETLCHTVWTFTGVHATHI